MHVCSRSLGNADGARAYESKPKQRKMDAVLHSGRKKQFTKTTSHDDDGEDVVAVGGVQCLDGWWTPATKASEDSHDGSEGGKSGRDLPRSQKLPHVTENLCPTSLTKTKKEQPDCFSQSLRDQPRLESLV